MRTFPRLALLPLLGAFGGFALSVPAGADPSPTVGELCGTAFSDPTSTAPVFSMDPAPRSDAVAGQVIRLSAEWMPGWDSLTGMAGCVEVDGGVSEALSGVETPPADDGAYEHRYNVPAGLPNGTVICHRMVMTGDPAGEPTAARWVSKQGCVEVHPEETAPPPPTSTPTAPPVNGGPASESPAPPAQPAAPQPPAASPPVSSPGVAAPGEATGAPSPPLNRGPAEGAPFPAPPGQPIYAPELPRTGAAPAALLLGGGLALATGLAALILGRRTGSIVVRPAANVRKPGSRD